MAQQLWERHRPPPASPFLFAFVSSGVRCCCWILTESSQHLNVRWPAGSSLLPPPPLTPPALGVLIPSLLCPSCFCLVHTLPSLFSGSTLLDNQQPATGHSRVTLGELKNLSGPRPPLLRAESVGRGAEHVAYLLRVCPTGLEWGRSPHSWESAWESAC